VKLLPSNVAPTGRANELLGRLRVPPRPASRLAVLAYHSIDDADALRAHLDYLARAHHFLPSAGLPMMGAMDNGTSASSVLVTFDDGDPSLVEVALPVLRERRVPAVAFVVAGVLDSDRPYWWREVKFLISAGARLSNTPHLLPDEAVRALKWLPEADRLQALQSLRRQRPEVDVRTPQLTRHDLRLLAAGGVEIANHTMTHPILSRCSDRRVAQEIVQAHEALTAAVGQPPRVFAFPDRDWDPRAKPILRELGYEAAFLFDHRLNRLPLRDPFAISRLRVENKTPMKRFRLVVNGIHPAIHHLIGRP
jgi:peptidoglycan/xylan/chitin deacetylase (PgdA/CDA1 family)